MLIDNFEQHFANCALKEQNAQKSAQNQINSLNTSKNQLIKIFRGFRGFRICSMAKNENPEMLETKRKLSKSKKYPVLTFYRY